MTLSGTTPPVALGTEFLRVDVAEVFVLTKPANYVFELPNDLRASA